METITSTDRAVQRVSLQQFIDGLRQTQGGGLQRRERHAASICEQNPVDPESLKPYLFWNAQHYTRNLIDKTDLYELLAICWEVGMVSSIHNHQGQNCWMAAPIGRLAVQNFRLISEDLGSPSLQHCSH